MISDQIICVNLNVYVDVNSDSIWDKNMYLQPFIDTENCQSRTDTLDLLSAIFLIVAGYGNKIW